MINRSCVRSSIDSELLEATQRQLDEFEGLPELAAAYRLLGDPTRLRMLTDRHGGGHDTGGDHPGMEH